MRHFVKLLDNHYLASKPPYHGRNPKKSENKIRKWLLVTAIFFTLYFAGRLIYYIVVNERRQLWVGLAVLMLISAVEAIRLYLAIKRESKKKDDKPAAMRRM